MNEDTIKILWNYYEETMEKGRNLASVSVYFREVFGKYWVSIENCLFFLFFICCDLMM